MNWDENNFFLWPPTCPSGWNEVHGPDLLPPEALVCVLGCVSLSIEGMSKHS